MQYSLVAFTKQLGGCDTYDIVDVSIIVQYRFQELGW